MGVFSLVRNFSLRSERVWGAIFGTDTWAGKPVTPDTAMQVATFWACVRLIAQTISTLPLGLYLRRDDGGREPASGPLYAILHDQPNADQTAAEFWEGVLAYVCVWGNAYAEKHFSGGQLIGLTLLRADLMAVYRDKFGALRFRYSDGGGMREFTDEEVFHVRGFGFGGDLGLSPVACARQTLGAAMADDEAAARTFANGMRPSGFFLSPTQLTQEQREQARRTLTER